MFTKFVTACHKGDTETVKHFLADPSFDPNGFVCFRNKYSTYSTNGFLAACSQGQSEIVSLLLGDSRTTVNTKKHSRMEWIPRCM